MSESEEESEGESWMTTVLEQWGLWRLKVFDMGCLFLAVFPVHCGGSCWSESNSSPWNSG